MSARTGEGISDSETLLDRECRSGTIRPRCLLKLLKSRDLIKALAPVTKRRSRAQVAAARCAAARLDNVVRYRASSWIISISSFGL